MGVRLDKWVSIVRKTGKGSDYLGNCECCGKPGSDFEAASHRFVWKRDDGQLYLGHAEAGETIGHHGCLLHRYGDLTCAETLKREKNIYLLPDYFKDKL